ncbi:MAG: TolC family protein [Deltaproteobacteria bacterium]|nr:TolC family protein [Deltaproteobacteria bacterium]
MPRQIGGGRSSQGRGRFGGAREPSILQLIESVVHQTYSKISISKVFWGEAWRGTFFQKRSPPQILFLKYYRCFILACAFALGNPSTLAISLDEALSAARKNAAELKTYAHELKAAKARRASLDGVFDIQLSDQASYTRDKTEDQLFNRDQTRITRNELAVEKMFGTGTVLKGSLTNTRTQVDFPPPTVVQISPAIQIPFDINFNYQLNPEYATKLQVELRQPLWRNWMAEEIRLQKKIAEGAQIGPQSNFLIQQQNIQAEVEALFLRLTLINKQVELTSQLVEKSKLFYTHMKRNVEYGRADLINATSAKARVVEIEGTLLDLQIGRDALSRQLSYRIFPERQETVTWTLPTLEQPFLAPAGNDRRDLTRKALAQRFDLRQLHESAQPLQDKLALLDERDKFGLDAFLSTGANKIEGSLGNSLGELRSWEHPNLTVGVKFSTTLGKNGNRMEREALLSELAQLDSRRVYIEQMITNQIDLAFEDRSAAHKLRSQADAHQKILEQQIEQERMRITQARSDQTAVIQYQMEILRVAALRAQAYTKEREAESRLRLLSHSYPQEPMGL